MEFGVAWECSCGHIAYAEESPEECEKCGSLDSFLQMPEEVLKTREDDLSIDDAPIKSVKKSKTTRRKK